ncbi:MAG TPA: ABC transporter ATP-binding protein, partial [Bacteroidetes bacterium]|nr:ABC transporter ATP-binding protein [Bacteroidota bacterium]
MTESSAPKLRLRRLNIIRFGGLQADLKLDPDRLTLIAGPNEAGKSTLLSALIAGL